MEPKQPGTKNENYGTFAEMIDFIMFCDANQRMGLLETLKFQTGGNDLGVPN